MRLFIRKNIYTIITKKKHMANSNKIIKDFNEEALSFAIQMGQLFPKSTIANNISYLKLMIKTRRKYLINQFTVYVLKYKDQIDNNDEKFFTENNYSDESSKNDNIISKVFEFKSIWSQLSEENKSGIFQVMQILCYYSQEYFLTK